MVNIVLMSKLRNIVLLMIIIAVLIVVRLTLLSSLTGLIFSPSEASYSDVLIEDIGEDNFLNATLKGCLKVGEESIPDAVFTASTGNWSWFDAKNVTYVNTAGTKEYMVIWKASADKYGLEKEENDSYLSDYLTDCDGKCFLLYSPEKNCVYGIVLGTGNIPCSEYRLIHEVLGLSTNVYPLMYSSDGSGYGSNYQTGGSSYHTVISDRYTLSRTDPGAYYDYYEYGDDYDIDDYLEAEGFD